MGRAFCYARTCWRDCARYPKGGAQGFGVVSLSPILCLCYRLLMAVFTPPTDPFVKFALPGEGGIFAALQGFPRGRNVFKLVDGSFTENQPSDPADIAIIYHGGHLHTLSASEEADLRAAGYGDYIA